MRKHLALKVGVLLSLIFLLVAVFGWDLLSDMRHLQQEAAVVENSNHQSHDLHAIEMGVYRNIKVVNDFLITGDHRSEGVFHQYQQKLVQMIEQYEITYQDSSLSDLMQSVKNIKGIAEKVFVLPFATENMEGPIFIDEIATEAKQAVEHLTRKHHALDEQVNRAMQMMAGLRMDMRQETVALMLVLLLSLGFLAYFIYNQIVHPLVQMKKAVQRVGEGNFDVHCAVVSDDEIGELAKAFNTMGEALQEREQKLNRIRSLAAHQEKMNALSVMSASLAHEVGNPLASVGMLLHMAKRKLAQQDTQAVASHLDSAVKETERMELIIQTVLDFGRHEFDMRFHAFAVRSVIADAVKLGQMSPQHKRVVIQVNEDSNMPLVYASSSMLMQVLMNVIHNACHACRESGEVHIQTIEQGGHIVIDVCDTGHGIEQAMRKSIFNPSVTTKEKGEGTGFGLAISKELMDAMHGTLSLLEDAGHGTCFRISVPIAHQGKGIT
ncbi:sensor histidine kinase [Ghiorsea bivora]|uniref:sensor histidine kinase n=1 Tax=Ghiorsea bivora TaxID=1485545 RepID=UPI00056DA194|nr:HAMP domain-containing histidine kinase [Ghiorsea bivora]